VSMASSSGAPMPKVVNNQMPKESRAVVRFCRAMFAAALPSGV